MTFEYFTGGRYLKARQKKACNENRTISRAGRPIRVDENLEIIHRKAFSAAEQDADLIILPYVCLKDRYPIRRHL